MQRTIELLHPEVKKLVPGARYLELPGIDHVPFVGENAPEIADAVEEFLTGSRPPVVGTFMPWSDKHV